MASKSVTFSCPCESCILLQVSKLEQKKLYKEADQVLVSGVQYFSSILKTLEDERKKLKVRQKSESNNNQENISSTFTCDESQRISHSSQCRYTSHHPLRRTKSREFVCPVAIFDEVENPKQKAAYPKNLVYADGHDYQLEEIRAAVYWSKNQIKVDQPTLSANIQKIIQSEHFKGSWSQSLPTSETILDEKDVKVEARISRGTPSDITNLQKPVLPNPVKNVKNILSPFNVENVNPMVPDIIPSLKKTDPDDSSHLINSLKSETEDKATLNDSQNTTCKQSQEVVKLKKSSAGQTSSTMVESMDLSSIPKILIQDTESKDEKVEKSVGLRSIRLPSENRRRIMTLKSTSSNVRITDRNNLSIIDNISNLLDSTWLSAPANSSEFKAPPVGEQEKAKKVQPLASATFVVRSTNDGTNEVSDNTLTPELKERSVLIGTLTEAVDFPPDEDEDDITCNTKAFSLVLPSSTPNRRRSQFFRPTNLNPNGTYTVDKKPHARYSRLSVVPIPEQNLSMIRETSQERYSSSSAASNGSGVVASKSQQPCERDKTNLTAIEETEEDCTKDKIVPDPFDLELIEDCLNKVQFPRDHHLNGYKKINCDMPQMRLTSTVELTGEKFSITGEIGKGSYARILKAHSMKKPSKMVALKQQKPPCTWEYYISKEIEKRLDDKEKCGYFIQYSDIYLFKNGSILMSEWAPYGSILNLVNKLKAAKYQNNRCPEPVVAFLGIQLITAVEYLHSCKIIHSDIKPDNFVLYQTVTPGKLCIKLIDYGRSIDMSLFPKNVAFTKVVTTEDFICNEMRENRTWTYQTDLFGLAGTIYLLLIAEYMKTMKRADGTWTMKKPLHRYLYKDLWNPIFNSLLNVPSSSQLPNLKEMRENMQAFYSSVDTYSLTQQFSMVSSILKK